MKVLFLDDCNMFEGHNPIATLVKVGETNEQQMRLLEKKQIGVYRMGGNWIEILSQGGISYKVLGTYFLIINYKLLCQ